MYVMWTVNIITYGYQYQTNIQLPNLLHIQTVGLDWLEYISQIIIPLIKIVHWFYKPGIEIPMGIQLLLYCYQICFFCKCILYGENSALKSDLNMTLHIICDWSDVVLPVSYN